MITSYRAKQSLEHEFGLRSFTPETTYYLGLSSTDPIEAITEPDISTGYSRVAIENNESSWSEVPDGEFYIQNAKSIEFPILTADAGIVTHWFLATSAAGDLFIYYGPLDVERPMPLDSQVVLRSGDMKIYRRNATAGE